MSKKLAIRGHSTRGKEVIELLEMMGGKNTEGYIGVDYDEIYTIEDGYIIQSYDWNDCLVFTLEEFLEKYPYKVGDKIPDVWGDSLTVKSMSWDENYKTVMYGFEESVFIVRADEMEAENEDKTIDNSIEASQFMQLGKTFAVCFNTANYENEVELQLGDYEIEVRDGRTFAVLKKSKYPTTNDDCCNMLNADEFVEYELMVNFPKLINARNAYWKIAGEEMGLGKPWEPDWSSFSEGSYPTITKCNGKIVKTSIYTHDCILAFPTTEMRDAFYENFKDLIEQCKELL